jgi:23S rRNA (cytidine1920-2'-O)/16S rRNA (cytidine1409-2'-O)-methyltransferase
MLPDARTAASWIMARKVRVDGAYLTKPGVQVSRDAALDVLGLDRRYVSRGGEKLEAALERFEVTVEGQVVLDAGASTGGFTDCLLQRGASTVYAVDAGHGQLRGSLATDPRVVALERTNISDLSRERLVPPLDLCVADLSYLSVSRSLPILAALFDREPRIVHLVKPLFEGLEGDQTKDRRCLEQLFRRLVDSAERCGLRLSGLMASPVLGSRGTIEFFGRFCSQAGTAGTSPDLFERVLDEAERVTSGPRAGVDA